nr:RNA-directed DNA polymerase, eukaryota, reverse transcriptase zinc-binding domain protein [Tanacetum cinerariifolium]
SGHFKKSKVPRKGGSILELIDDLVNDGEVVIMGDFNEVCDISERFGSIFNKHGAKAFNSFIVNAGLVEVPLGEGSDADGDRRREVVQLIQEVEKVDAMEVAQKAKIKWSIEGDENSKYYDGVLDKKRGRLTICEIMVDAKIKWSIEGDENSKYYDGVLDKKRGRLTICEIMVDGIWMESPHLVKHEFFERFKNRFEKPNKSRILLERDFVKKISLEDNDDLEREVSNEEIKRAV